MKEPLWSKVFEEVWGEKGYPYFDLDKIIKACELYFEYSKNEENITRVEIIDHYTEDLEKRGRIFVHKITNQDRKIELDWQDNNRTLKVFISKNK